MRVTTNATTIARPMIAKPSRRPATRIMTSSPEECQPGDAGDQEDERRVDQQQRNETLLEPRDREHEAQRDPARHSGKQAEDPSGKERPVDVDDGIAGRRQDDGRDGGESPRARKPVSHAASSRYHRGNKHTIHEAISTERDKITTER